MKARRPDLLTKAKIAESDPRFATAPDDWHGRYLIKGPRGDFLLLMISTGEVWGSIGLPPPACVHVSVSVRDGRFAADRTPTWEEMAWVKDLCWEPEECVIQFHPPKSDYVNHHAGVLHLWKPVGIEIPRPPSITVGPKAA